MITINTQNVSAPAVVTIEMIDRSNAHVDLVLQMGNLPPIHHAFDFQEGAVSIPLPDLKKGKHRCSLIVHAFKHKLSLGRMYDVALTVNGQAAASASGNIPAGRNNDIGIGDFVLTVT